MKDIRLCDDGDITTTIDLCEENNLGIEIQGFYNPYIDILSNKKGDIK